ncbi:MAG: type II toxin-antitoxin system HicB family antitoxin [Trueperaceae bacterium]|nr:type II toxin-antitoxin system HicB family antitoxin [Trueperaceae bacterium]
MSLNTMQYRGYTATIEYDGDDRLFVGDVMDLADTISFTGRTVEELEAGFATAVDAYVDWCAERGKEPARPFSGRLNLRFDPALHREAALAAAARRTSLNAFLVACIEQGLRAFRTGPRSVEGEAADLDVASVGRPEGPVGSGSAIAPPAANGRRR